MTNKILHNIKVLPKHIAIIMDGNGRWAKKNGKERFYGHQKGVETVKRIVEVSAKIKLEYLSLFAFSTENWNRPTQEVDALMELLVTSIPREIPSLLKNNIRLLAIGDLARLPKNCYDSIQDSIEKTSKNTGLTLCIAISYSGKWDIIQASKQMAINFKNGDINESELSETTFNNLLNTKNIPDPELLIRTSGEKRISNFFLWQCAYSELYFSDKYWPEFSDDDFFDALNYFQNIERRFGKTSEQLK